MKDIERNAAPRRLDDTDMLSPQFTGVPAPTGVGDHVDLPIEALHVVQDPCGLVFDHQTSLEVAVVGRHAGGAGIGVATHRLDAAYGEHESPGRVNEVGAGAEGPCRSGGGDKLS